MRSNFVDGWNITPSIFHYDSGTVISASDPWWLEAAVARFIKSSRARNGKREAHTGLMRFNEEFQVGQMFIAAFR